MKLQVVFFKKMRSGSLEDGTELTSDFQNVWDRFSEAV